MKKLWRNKGIGMAQAMTMLATTWKATLALLVITAKKLLIFLNFSGNRPPDRRLSLTTSAYGALTLAQAPFLVVSSQRPYP
jgi:hypothetical protein